MQNFLDWNWQILLLDFSKKKSQNSKFVKQILKLL